MLRAAHYDHAALNRQEELPLLSGIAANIPDLRVLEQSIGSAISPAGEILDSASPTLRQLRQNTRAAYNQLNETMQRSLRRLQRQALVQEPIITQRNGRLVLLIKAEMKSQAHGIVHDVSDSGATVFIEPMAAIEPGNRWREYRLAEEREEERVLQELSTLVGQVGEDLQLGPGPGGAAGPGHGQGPLLHRPPGHPSHRISGYGGEPHLAPDRSASPPALPTGWCPSAWNWGATGASC